MKVNSVRKLAVFLIGLAVLSGIGCRRGNIAATPLSGQINEKEANVASVRIQKSGESYRWVFSNKVPPTPCEPAIGDEAVTFVSTTLLQSPFEKKMEDPVPEGFQAFYHYELTPGSPVTINAPWAAKFVIDKIETEKKRVTGWARIEFKDQKTVLSGAFEATLCE